MEKIRLGIVGYGNLGKGVEAAIKQNDDLELVAIFSRRPENSLKINSDCVEVVQANQAKDFKGRIDVMLLCGGSATDLPVQGPEFSAFFNTVDSFDTHTRIPEYFSRMDEIARKSGKTSAISIGWDPGLFSLNRVLGQAVLPEGKDYTFWGKGVSQGHSDAIRQIEGVRDAIQYTIPLSTAVERVRSGETPDLDTADKHLRECYVVVEEGADKDRIRNDIKTMPNYFAGYETCINFIAEKELREKHSGMPHGGFVIRSGKTGKNKENNQIMEFSLKLDSNPEFTSSVLVAYARAVYRLNKEGQTGAKTVFDIPISYLLNQSQKSLIKEIL
ncbi:MAG TPA: diaminopimelate dehydrogenase [Halanaerobiales bacterium]|nr:diaminopimelate dehydrogenase [Halanaerobiales bacterium]